MYTMYVRNIEIYKIKDKNEIKLDLDTKPFIDLVSCHYVIKNTQ